MVAATDSARTFPVRSAWMLIVLVSSIGETGCAQLGSFRKTDKPAFGTYTASNEKSREHGSGSGDLYAELVKKPRDSNARLLAQQRPRAKATLDPELVPDVEPIGRITPRDAPMVALESPVTLPAWNDGKLSEPGSEPRSPARVEQLASTSEPMTFRRVPPSESNATVSQASASPAQPALINILAESRSTLMKLASYRVNMTHQERVAGRLNPVEDVLLSIRQSPKAVRIEWLEGLNKGREVLYASDQIGGKMHVRMGNPLLPRISLDPDSPMATRNSRHPISEAGYDTIILGMETAVRGQAAGDPTGGTVRYDGLEIPDGFVKPCHKIIRNTPANETWVVYIDPDTHLPALVQETDGNGELLERYAFRDPVFNLPDLAQVEAFDPDARWGPPKGLFSRLAGGDKDSRTR